MCSNHNQAIWLFQLLTLSFPKVLQFCYVFSPTFYMCSPWDDQYIRWACDGYAQYGSLYTAEKEILPELITGENTKIIQPRTAKSKEEQQNRTRKSAEVYFFPFISYRNTLLIMKESCK